MVGNFLMRKVVTTFIKRMEPFHRQYRITVQKKFTNRSEKKLKNKWRLNDTLLLWNELWIQLLLK